MDEFDDIARLFRPLTFGAPEALGLLDDAAVIPAGSDALIVTSDTVVEGVHTPLGEAPEWIARKVLRVNLSDVAAKGAQPYGWLLNIAWPETYGATERQAFAGGLAVDAQEFGLKLFGGDTVRTTGPLTATVTMLAKAPGGRFVARGGALPGDVLLVSGAIGDAGLGLRAALGQAMDGVSDEQAGWLLDRYRRPQPRLDLRDALLAHATACADVSDGLLADAGRIGIASGVSVEIDLDAIPLSKAASSWVGAQPDRTAASLHLATAGDDYELVCTCRAEDEKALRGAAEAAGVPLTRIGSIGEGSGVAARRRGEAVPLERLGYVHR